MKDSLRFITCGSVDDGKSTLIGRLLYETKLIFEDQLEALKQQLKVAEDQSNAPSPDPLATFTVAELLDQWMAHIAARRSAQLSQGGGLERQHGKHAIDVGPHGARTRRPARVSNACRPSATYVPEPCRPST